MLNPELRKGSSQKENENSPAESVKLKQFWGQSVLKVPTLDEFAVQQGTKPESIVEAYKLFLTELGKEKRERERLYSDYVGITLKGGEKTYMTFEEFEARNYGIV